MELVSFAAKHAPGQDNSRDASLFNEDPQPEGSHLMSSPLPTERTAVVTGGASPRGIGRATADRLARDGWSVAILDIDEAAAKLAADEVADKYSVSTLGVGADI